MDFKKLCKSFDKKKIINNEDISIDKIQKFVLLGVNASLRDECFEK